MKGIKKMKKKEEKEFISMITIGSLLVIGSYAYMGLVPLRKFGWLAIGVGLLPLLYNILSEKKRFSKAKITEIDEMSGLEFEDYVVYLLLNSGYQKAENTGEGPDQGVDVRAVKDKVKYGIQCKRWKNKVGNKAIQEIHAGKDYYQLDQAIVVTNSFFTASAKELAKRLNIELWDRTAVIQMIEKVHQQKKKA